MADKTINTLDTELVAVGANDLIGVWDVAAAQYKKAKRSNVVGAILTGGGTIATGGYTMTVPATGTAALLSRVQTFSAIQTFGAAINVGLFNNAADTNIASDGTYLFNYSAAIVLIHDRSSGAAGMFLLKGSGLDTVELIDSGNIFSKTKNTASSWNVYYEGGNYYLQNKIGVSRAVHIWEFA